MAHSWRGLPRGSGARAFGELLVGLGAGALGLVLLARAASALTDPPDAAASSSAAASSATPTSIPPAGSAPNAVPAPDTEGNTASAPKVASYELVARLEATTHVVSGSGTLRWTNTSRTPVQELYFHLYLNAFKNDRTLFLRSPFGAGRSGDHASTWGYVDVTRLRVRELGEKDLWPGASKTSPGDADDETDIRVPLPSPIEPGRSVTIDLEWSSKLPEIVERTGHWGSFHFVAQWFPKIARLEPDGTWAHFPFHPQAEFYADFGSYSVTLDVPESMIVGATGRNVREERADGRKKLLFEAEGVHDFAWTAWERFRERAESIDGVAVRVLFPPSHESNAETTLAALRFALPRYSRLYGRYPHPTLTVVHPPDGARNAGGMEYPTLITTGGPWWLARSGIRAVEGVTVHELGHQWFQGIIATNEPKWPYLDEGLNTYAEVEAMDAAYGAGSVVDTFGLTLNGEALRRLDAMDVAHDDAIAQPAARFSSFRSIGALVYSRTSTVLSTLGNVYGREALERAVGQYARRYRFGHPGPDDFEASIREVMGAEAATTLRRALFEKGWVDHRVEALDCVDASEPAGVFERGAGRVTESPKESGSERRHRCRVLVRRLGTLDLPVELELHLADGTRQRRRWPAGETWASFEHVGNQPVVAALIDPDLLVLLDGNLGNNGKRARRQFGHRALERITYAGQLCLGWFGP